MELTLALAEGVVGASFSSLGPEEASDSAFLNGERKGFERAEFAASTRRRLAAGVLMVLERLVLSTVSW